MDKETRQASIVAASVSLSWAGLYLHNLEDLTGNTLLSLENLLPAAISLFLFLLWYLWPEWTLTSFLLLILGLVHLIGGVLLSVLPLSIGSIEPAQMTLHYSFHVIYALAQAPLIIVMLLYIRNLYKSQSS